MYIDNVWMQLWLKNHCKNTEYYSIFQLLLLLFLNNYQHNCNNTISSVSVDLVLPPWAFHPCSSACSALYHLCQAQCFLPVVEGCEFKPR